MKPFRFSKISQHSIPDIITFISFFLSGLYIFDRVIDSSLRFALSSLYYGQLNYLEIDSGVWIIIRTTCYVAGILVTAAGGISYFLVLSIIFKIVKKIKETWKNQSTGIMLQLTENKLINSPLGYVATFIYLILLCFNSNFFIGYLYFGILGLGLFTILYNLMVDISGSSNFINLIKITLLYLVTLCFFGITIFPLESWILQTTLRLSKVEINYNPQAHFIIDQQCLSDLKSLLGSTINECNSSDNRIICFNKFGSNVLLKNYISYIDSAKLLTIESGYNTFYVKLKSCKSIKFVPVKLIKKG